MDISSYLHAMHPSTVPGFERPIVWEKPAWHMEKLPLQVGFPPRPKVQCQPRFLFALLLHREAQENPTVLAEFLLSTACCRLDVLYTSKW